MYRVCSTNPNESGRSRVAFVLDLQVHEPGPGPIPSILYTLTRTPPLPDNPILEDQTACGTPDHVTMHWQSIFCGRQLWQCARPGSPMSPGWLVA